ncbi:unnamed protein product [Cyclocybe aegerita]|uniref:CHAT domain-containing protein n=1 Tax=Cyclocybe aegerita TaxID=1973307 RepID=A0A8S0WDE6_CYCAE|nr:unnamed protein product [Cyclocybe aegerita]
MDWGRHPGECPFSCCWYLLQQCHRRKRDGSVVSSYFTSSRALVYSTQRKDKKYLHRKRDANILVAKMGVTEASSASMDIKTLDTPSKAIVLEKPPLYNFIHFACHGVSDPRDPLKSHLLLDDGALTVQEIFYAHSAGPEVVFLSACSTAEGQDARVVDESIHFASASS